MSKPRQGTAVATVNVTRASVTFAVVLLLILFTVAFMLGAAKMKAACDVKPVTLDYYDGAWRDELGRAILIAKTEDSDTNTPYDIAKDGR